MLGFNGISVTPISALQDVAPEFGWFGQFQQPVIARIALAVLISAPVFVPQPPATAAETAIEFGWYWKFADTAARTTKPPTDGFRIGFSSLDQPFGWFENFDYPSRKPSQGVFRDGISWSPQATFSLTATPSELGWLAPADIRKSNRPPAVLDSGYRIGFPAAETPFGWFGSFATPVTHKATAALGNAFTSGYSQIPAETTAEFGWAFCFDVPRVRPIPVSRDGFAIGYAQDQIPVPVPFGWFKGFDSQSLQKPSVALRDGIKSPLYGHIAAQIQIGWLRSSDAPADRNRPRVLSAGVAWAPQVIADAVVAPPEFGWYRQFGKPNSVIGKPNSVLNVAFSGVYPPFAPSLGWYGQFDRLGSKSSRGTTALHNGITGPLTAPAPVVTGTGFGWFSSWPVTIKVLGFTRLAAKLAHVPRDVGGTVYTPIDYKVFERVTGKADGYDILGHGSGASIIGRDDGGN